MTNSPILCNHHTESTEHQGNVIQILCTILVERLGVRGVARTCLFQLLHHLLWGSSDLHQLCFQHSALQLLRVSLSWEGDLGSIVCHLRFILSLSHPTLLPVTAPVGRVQLVVGLCPVNIDTELSSCCAGIHVAPTGGGTPTPARLSCWWYAGVSCA